MGPDNRGFDSPELYREDALIRIGRLEAEIRERTKKIRELERSISGEPPYGKEDDECE